jgi:NTE family protein
MSQVADRRGAEIGSEDREANATHGIVFVLSGGGNLGAVQVGMLYALLEAGIRPDAIVGTSIGALNGAFVAGHSDLAGVEELAELWASVRRHEVFPFSMRVLAHGVFGHQQFLFESLGLRSLLLRAQIGFSRLEDAPIPLHVMATDLRSGEAVVLNREETIPALLASSAIPGVLPPVEIDGRMLIDGGVVANTPIATAEALNPSSVYVLPTVPDDLVHPPGNAIVMMQRAVALAAQPAERRALAEASARRSVQVLPVPTAAGHLSIFDFKMTERLIDESYTLTAKWLGRSGTKDAATSDEPVPAVSPVPEPSVTPSYRGAVA